MTDRRVDQPRGPAPGPSGGLTLIEVLVAMALLGIGLAVIFQGIGLGLRARRDSDSLRRIVRVADRELNRLLIAGEPPGDAEEGEEGGISWTVERHPAAQAAAVSGEEGETSLVPVRIVVRADGGRSREIVTLMRETEE